METAKPPYPELLTALTFTAVKQNVVDQLHEAFGVSAEQSKLQEVLIGLRGICLSFDKLTGQANGTAWREFEVQDSLVFPVIFATNLGEFETVDLFRISPKDSSPIPGIDTAGEGVALLKGSSLMAFGGFLDQSWALE